MSTILASLLGNTALPLISELASSLIYPRVVSLAAEGTNLLASFDASHPLVGEAVAFARDMLGANTPAGEASDVDAALAKLVQAGVSKLAAIDPSVTGTTVTASTTTSASASEPATPATTGSELASVAASAASAAVADVTPSILSRIEGLFTSHAATVSAAVSSSTAAPRPVNVGAPTPAAPAVPVSSAT